MKTLLVVLLVPAILFGCGGIKPSGSGAVAGPATPATWELIADRLAAVQSVDGSFAVEPQVHVPFSDAVAGDQNVTGVAALGLFDAYAADPRPAWRDALTHTKDYLVDQMRGYVAGSIAAVSIPNFSFLVRYKEVFGIPDPAQWEPVHAAFSKLLADTDATDGTDSSVIIDGILNHVRDARLAQSLPGLVPWDCAFVLTVAKELFTSGPEIVWAAEFQKALMSGFDLTNPGAYASVGHTLEALLLVGDFSIQGELLIMLNSGLDQDGSIQHDVQATTYAIRGWMAMNAGDLAAGSLAWLKSQVDSQGRIYAPTPGVEASQVEGEALSALLK